MERMNRQFRREMQRQERTRQKRAEQALAKRRRARERIIQRRQEARAQLPSFRSWLTRPYKSIDMLLLFFILWGLRWAAMSYVGGEEAAASDLARALLVAQGAFALVVLLYIFGIARDGFQWYGPADRQLPAPFVWGGGIALGIVILGLGRIFTLLLAAALPADSSPAEVGLVSPLTWSDLTELPMLVAAGLAFTFVVLIPFGDEFYYRRILGRIFMQGRMSEGWVIFSTAMLYTLGSGGVFPLPAAAAGGLVLGFVWMRTQSMGLVILAHGIQALGMLFLG